MGHIRLGRLAKTHSWNRLAALLDLSAPDVEEVATTTAEGARQRLLELRTDPVLGYALWLLARVTTAARSDDFVGEASHLGLQLASSDSTLGVIARINELIRHEVERHPESGPFGEIASLALRRALVETVGLEQPALFGSTMADLQRAMRKHTTDRAFGDLSRRFFGDYLARTLKFYVDKELPFHIGNDSGFANVHANSLFLDELDVYTRQSAKIVESFAADWLSKHAFLTEGYLGREQAQAFAAHAMTKLHAELDREVVA